MRKIIVLGVVLASFVLIGIACGGGGDDSSNKTGNNKAGSVQLADQITFNVDCHTADDCSTYFLAIGIVSIEDGKISENASYSMNAADGEEGSITIEEEGDKELVGVFSNLEKGQVTFSPRKISEKADTFSMVTARVGSDASFEMYVVAIGDFGTGTILLEAIEAVEAGDVDLPQYFKGSDFLKADFHEFYAYVNFDTGANYGTYNNNSGASVLSYNSGYTDFTAIKRNGEIVPATEFGSESLGPLSQEEIAEEWAKANEAISYFRNTLGIISVAEAK